MASRVPEYQPGQGIPGTVYRVHKVLGAGGMGTVYEVEDTSVGKRYVLKTLHSDLAERVDLAARLGREARALARLQHPNIVEVYTSGTTSDALRLPYYVMERLQGQSLRAVIERKGRLTIEQACDIGSDLLAALDHAHEFGIIHRDVKPDNIFVTRGRDGRPLAKLLDFGIIKLATHMGTNTLHPTAGRFIGTFRYAPPEQIRSHEVTPRSDLYAAGLVLYEMVAGRGPFDDFTGEMEIGKAHIDVAPPPITRFVQVPETLAAIIMSALQKDPAQRPRDAFTFASALRDLKRQLGLAAQARSRSQTQATVEQLVMPPVSSERPATPSFATQQQLEMAPAEGTPTRIDAPAGMNAPTRPSVPSGRVNHTVSLGVRPISAPLQQTFAAAPLTMANGEVPAIVDRRAETREAIPVVAPQPNYDTAPIPLAVLAPRGTSAPTGTFGPLTTEASQRKRAARTTFYVLLGCGMFVAGGASLALAVRRHHDAAAAPPPTLDVPAPRSPPSVATVEPTPVPTEPSGVTALIPAASTLSRPSVVPSHAISARTVTPRATSNGAQPLPTATTTTTPAPSATTSHRRPGSGL